MKRNKIPLTIFVVLTLVFFKVHSFGDQKDEEIKELLAESYIASGQHERAIELYRTILEEDPDGLKARKNLADLLSWEKKFEEAIEEYEKVLRLDPDDADVKASLARVLFWKGDLDEAETFLREALEREPDETEKRVLLGRVLAGKNKFNEALEYLEDGTIPEERILYGQALLYAGKPQKALNVLKHVLKGDPEDEKALLAVAEYYVHTREYDRAIEIYRGILQENKSDEARKRLAETLSWTGAYKEALELYDDILRETYDPEAHRKKARVLGWARRYDEAEEEYQKLLEESGSEIVKLEMRAKRSYYAGRSQSAAAAYEELLKKEPENAEALFDLGQIYFAGSVLERSASAFERILGLYPDHFRARRAISKLRLMTESISIDSFYEFFKAESDGRQTDIRRHSATNIIGIPLNAKTSLGIEHVFWGRVFPDSSDIYGNRTLMRIRHTKDLAFKAGAHYGIATHTAARGKVHHLFGGEMSFSPDDVFTFSLEHKRSLLENNSSVLEKNLYSDNFKARVEIDLARRLKAGVDKTFAYYSDDNMLMEPGGDVLYFFMFEPRMLFLRYRYGYKEYSDKGKEYWTPKGLTTNSIRLSWRHFFNKEELYPGGDDLFYELAYEISLDSEDIVEHRFMGGLNWDINQRLNIEVTGSMAASSGGVYKERQIRGGLRYFF